MVWTALAISAMSLSCISTGITSYSLRHSWDLQVSSVRWLFFIFFTCYCVYSASRLAYMVSVTFKTSKTMWINATEDDETWGNDDEDDYMSEHYTTVGIFAPLHSRVSKDPLLIALLVLGDSVHFSVATWMFPLIYELGLIARKTMDRGAEKEQEQIQWYLWCLWPIIAVFAIAETTVVATQNGYTTTAQGFQLGVYFTMFASFLYMLIVVLRLKWGGRKYENVQGQFVTSPIYQRISRILAIYAIFTLQYQLASVISYSLPNNRDDLSGYTSLSTVIYCISGLALAVTTMCSQACVLQLCRCCMPDDVEAQVEARLMQPGELLSPQDTQILVESAEPPLVNPVFVFTDIQQSSALWGIGDGLIMQRATELHDNILRSLLMKYRGYEITTAGDAFQLAFHTVREAVEYCMDVQLKLLEAPWPNELHGLLPATKKKRKGRHLIFCGLRVRMGIHDAMDSDGLLVLDVHAVTGKMIYTGTSEVIANEVGDLGDGGQILVTKRVADWVKMYADLIEIPCSINRVGEYTVPQIHSTVEVFQVLPMVLAKRKKQFATTFTSTLKRRPVHGGNAVLGVHSITLNDAISTGISTAAAERRRTLDALRERRRQLEQGALSRPASHQTLIRTVSSSQSDTINTRPSYARTSSM